MIYHLTKATDEYLEVSSDTERAELVFISIFYLIAENDKTEIVGYKWNYTVKLSIDTLMFLLPPNMFLRIHDKYVVGREHVGKFENNEVHMAKMKLPVGAGYVVAKEDFPFVASPELGIQGAIKDMKINKRWREN